MNDADRTLLEDSAKAWAAELKLPYFDTRADFNLAPLVGKLTIEGMKAYRIVPIGINGKKLTLAINEQTDRTQLDTLKTRLAATYDVEYTVISDFGWERIFNRFQLGDNLTALEGHYEDFQKRVENAEPKQQFNVIVQLAYQLGVSDIHLEPAAERARIRFRIDGALHPIIYLDKARYDLLTSDLQMRAGAKWGADEPQAGRIQIPLINGDGDIVPINMRLETIPSLHGQDVVVRIFSFNVSYLKLDALDLTKDQRAHLEKTISHPRGLVLTVGPTGSGKTSSLYSIINQLNADNVKIVTLEDPVEYELEGVSQLPVVSENKEAFMNKLRAVLREDPNIIMIGEIRDADTARTALQAALTGHIVLSTFHAANSSGAVIRLMDMIGENPLLASSLRMVMAQRLVRRLCPTCRKSEKPTHDELMQIKAALHGLPAGTHKPFEEIMLNRPVGCPECHGFGYRGRVGLFEQLEITLELEALISRGTAATTAQAIESLAVKQGMITLLQSGILQVVAGTTSLTEVYSAVGA